MLTIRPMDSGKGYSAKYLEQSDYYEEGKKITGQWFGKGATRLGLNGEVIADDFEAVRQGLHPETGDPLRPRQSADRKAKDGTVQSTGRELYDLTFSAPKSVSVMACIGEDKRVIEVHNRAVREALAEAERAAQTRVRKGLENTDRVTGNLVSACYFHSESRDIDPQLHTHCATANLTYDSVEKRWKALQMSGIFRETHYLTEVYRNELARGLQEIGYEVEYRWNTKMTDRNVEIKGISEELCYKHSQMSQRRDAAVTEFTEEHGRMPTHNEETILLRRVRPEKRTDLSSEEVHALQVERCSREDLAAIAETRRKADARVFVPEMHSAERSVQYGLDHVFERVSVANDYRVMEQALRNSRGQATLAEIKAQLIDLEVKGRIFTHKGELATEESLQREKSMIGMIDNGVGRFTPLRGNKEFVASDKLNPKQKEAVEFVLNSRDLAVNLQGAPGTRKTWTLQDVKRGLEEAGRPVLALAPTKSAEEELKSVGFGQAMTIEGLLQDKDAQPRMHNRAVIIDEAGMISAKQMFDLLSLAQRCGSRIIFSGDTRQIQSVEAGDSLRILENESKLASIELTEITRQKNPEYLAAIKAMRKDPARGFELLSDAGAIHEVSDADRPAAVAKARREAQGQTLVVCPTHAEIAAVTAAIREDRKAHNELGEGRTIERLEPLNWTLAEKSDMRNYQPGQVLVFHRPTVAADRHEAFEVLSVKDIAVLVRNQDGDETQITPKQARSFGVFAKREIEVAPGDVLLLQGNRRGPDLNATNGQFVTVKQFDEQGRMQLEDGRTLPEDFKTFNHGYATTAHKSQGKTVDNVIISGNAMTQEQFYVGSSRGRESIQIFTEDKEWLEMTAGISGARTSATELADRIDHEAVNAAKIVTNWYTDFETGAPTQDATRAQPTGYAGGRERGFAR
jgi:conjugative relaxase-like TrwC/TraI family protein